MNEATIELADRAVTIGVSVSKRARNISLRVDERSGQVELVLPRFVSQAEGLAFARRKAPWIQRQIEALPPRVRFVDGAVLPLAGVAHQICHQPGGRGGVQAVAGTIYVSGDVRHLARRIREWLRLRARREFAERSCRLAARVGRPVKRVAVRDTRSRWGSCSEKGYLSFSWRLLFAPEAVLDYVVAHEVAHLIELNHGARFWRVVNELCPNHRTARRWLKEFGATLHRFG